MDDELEQRLGALGSRPVDAAVAEAHHLAMRGVVLSPPRRFQFGWRAVAAAAFVGFLAGSTGLAAAGTLPDPAQDLAHDVLARVGVNVPRSTEGCPEGRTYRNHGEYVAEVEAAGGDVEAAAHSDCGKPANRGHGGGGQPGVPREDTDGNPCTGPPPWAGAHLPADQRALLQEQRRALCGDTEATDESDEADEVEEPEQESTPTTTTPPTTATTTATTTAETTTTVEATTTTETTTTTTG